MLTNLQGYHLKILIYELHECGETWLPSGFCSGVHLTTELHSPIPQGFAQMHPTTELHKPCPQGLSSFLFLCLQRDWRSFKILCMFWISLGDNICSINEALNPQEGTVELHSILRVVCLGKVLLLLRFCGDYKARPPEKIIHNFINLKVKM